MEMLFEQILEGETVRDGHAAELRIRYWPGAGCPSPQVSFALMDGDERAQRVGTINALDCQGGIVRTGPDVPGHSYPA